MLFVIIENDKLNANNLDALLRGAYPESRILPGLSKGEYRVFGDWAEVLVYLAEIVSEDEVVVLWDLALHDGDFPEADLGLKKGREILSLHPSWILVAYTRYGLYVKNKRTFKEAFQGIIEKGELESFDERDDRISFVRSVVESARSIKKGGDIYPENLKIEDSLGMRLFHAAFGNVGLSELLAMEAHDWTERRIEALASGFSGSFLLSISGNTSRGRRSVVLKVAKSEKVLQDEIASAAKYVDQIEILEGHLVTLVGGLRRLIRSQAFYYKQAHIRGVTMLHQLKKSKWPSSRRYLRPVAQLCVEMCKKDTPKWAEIPAENILSLTALDKSRFEASVSFLTALGSSIRRRRLWPKHAPEPNELGSKVLHLVRNWNRLLTDGIDILTAVQHGDLNPGNIILKPKDTFVFIDLQRLGPWPLGYDLARLSLMLRLRMTDSKGNADWLPMNLSEWYADPLIQLHTTADKQSLCPEARYCQQLFGNFSENLPLGTRNVVEYGYLLCSAWDLVKVTSYQDASPIKKLWAMLELGRLSRDLKKYASQLRTPK